MTEKSLLMPSLFGFTQFCGAQGASASYPYSSNRSCAFAQYLQSLGHTGIVCGGIWWNSDQMPGDNDIPHYRAISAWPHTFGALYKRLKSGGYRG